MFVQGAAQLSAARQEPVSTPERSLARKMRETLAGALARAPFHKDQILEIYLNRVYCGAGTYGVDCRGASYLASRRGAPLSTRVLHRGFC